MSKLSHWVKLRAPLAFGWAETRPREVLELLPAEMPLEMIRERVFLPRWIILVPVSACWRPLVTATEENSPELSAPRRMQEGYFQVIAKPVSTWVQETFERGPRQSARLVTK